MENIKLCSCSFAMGTWGSSLHLSYWKSRGKIRASSKPYWHACMKIYRQSFVFPFLLPTAMNYNPRPLLAPVQLFQKVQSCNDDGRSCMEDQKRGFCAFLFIHPLPISCLLTFYFHLEVHQPGPLDLLIQSVDRVAGNLGCEFIR